MARYTCSYIVALSPEDSETSLNELLKSCNFDLLYNNADYFMARETPGQVTFTQLVTIEVLIDEINPNHEGLRLTFVVKNEELPLQIDNHCQRIFALLQSVIAQDYQWQSAENVFT